MIVPKSAYDALDDGVGRSGFLDDQVANVILNLSGQVEEFKRLAGEPISPLDI
jgi:hypothetical protein